MMATRIHRARSSLVLYAAAVLTAGLLALVGAKPAGAAEPNFAQLQHYPVGSTPTTVTNADFNGDGKVDLAAQNAGDNNVSVLLGNGDGTFPTERRFPVGSNPTSVISADFNADTEADLAVANWSSNNVSVLLGNGDGTFKAKQDFAAGSNPTSVTTAHFNDDNADGKVDSADFVDLAVADYADNDFDSSDGVTVLWGNGDGSFQAPRRLSIRPPCGRENSLDCPPGLCFDFGCIRHPVVAAPNQVVTADFNRDGRVDVATASVGDAECTSILGCKFIPGGISVLSSNPDGTYQGAKLVKRNTRTDSLTTEDFNGDGRADLAATEMQSNVVSVLLGNGDGTFQTERKFSVGTNPSAVTSVNLDADSRADLAVTNFTSDNVSVLFGDGSGGFQAAQNFPAGDGPIFVTSAHFNDDGEVDFADLAVANQNSNSVSVLGPPPPPETTITSGPPDRVKSASATFEFSSSEPGSTFQCALDSPSTYSLCTSPQTYDRLSEGSHTFYVRSTGGAGNNTDPTPATRTWTVDTTAPTVGSVSPPDLATDVALDTNVTATFSEAMNEDSVEAPGTFTLKQGTSPVTATVTYDSATKKATLDPGSNLAWNTTYTATIMGGSSGAKDSLGNTLERDFRWTFSTANDTTAPSTTLTLSPQPNAAGWNKENVTLRLSATDGASGVKEISYSINGEPNTVQQSSVQIPITDEGESTISYHATDNAGNPEESQTFTVKVDKTAPQVTPDDVVNNVWRNVPLTGEFTASDSGSGLTNSADASFTLAASEESASANQPTVASRTVFDAAGNSTTRKVSALIDLTSPQATASSQPVPNTAGWNNSNVAVTLNATDPGGSGVKEIVYSASGAQAIPSTTVPGGSVTVNINTEGTTTISYFATDKAGNREAPPETFEVKLDKSAPTLDTDNSDGSDGITPHNRETGVSRSVEPMATFSEEMDRTSLGTSVKLYQWNARKHKWQAVPVAVSVVGEKATLDPYPDDPSRLLAANKKFKVTVTTGAKDLAGLPLSSTRTWTFTTRSR